MALKCKLYWCNNSLKALDSVTKYWFNQQCLNLSTNKFNLQEGNYIFISKEFYIEKWVKPPALNMRMLVTLWNVVSCRALFFLLQNLKGKWYKVYLYVELNLWGYISLFVLFHSLRIGTKLLYNTNGHFAFFCNIPLFSLFISVIRHEKQPVWLLAIVRKSYPTVGYVNLSFWSSF